MREVKRAARFFPTISEGIAQPVRADVSHASGRRRESRRLILSLVGLLFPANHAPMKLASLTGFAPVISCMRGRHVVWLHHRDRNGEGRRLCTSDLMHVTHPLSLLSYTLKNGEGPCGRRSACCPLFLSHVKHGGRAQAPLLMSYVPGKWSG